MIELAILLFIASFSIIMGWEVGKIVALWIGSWVSNSLGLIEWILQLPQRLIRRLITFVRFAKTEGWHWLFRRKKLIETMKKGSKDGNHWGDEQTWALAERLKHSDRGRSSTEK